jgi:VWFA-related protein
MSRAMVRSVNASLLAAALLWATPAWHSGARVGQAQATTQKPVPQDPQKPPVFRGGTNFVLVDAYPRRDGKIVEGLKAADFQVFEDGKPQQVESLEFIRVEPHTPDADRIDPNSQAEANRQAADPRNRVFVLYLDHYHAGLRASHAMKRPVIDMLNRMLAPNDLFGVATVHTLGRDLILGRKTLTLEEQLEKHWTWGLSSGVIDLEPDEQHVQRCYGDGLALEVASRLREERVFIALRGLVSHLGGIREGRKVLLLFSRGWALYRPDRDRLHRVLDVSKGDIPRVGVSTGGKLTTTPAVAPGMADWTRCNTMIDRAFNLDNYRTFQDLIREANLNNVTFYPVDPNGLGTGVNHVLESLAEETDGFTYQTNDMSELLRKVTDDVSAYYLLGYYSTNATPEGGYRRIEVKMAQPGVSVKARRGYLLPALSSSAAPAAARAVTPEGFDDAMGLLSRLRPSSELFAFGAAMPNEVVVAVEIGAQTLTAGPWAKGADVTVTVTNAAGQESLSKGRIEPGARAALVRIPTTGEAPFKASVRVTAGGENLREQLEIAAPRGALVGQVLLYRATPSGQSPLRPVGDLQYRRTERVHLEWPILRALDRRDARLLSRDSKALPVQVTVTERPNGDQSVVAADLNLAPLAPGDYVIELTVASGTQTETRFVAIRVRQ